MKRIVRHFHDECGALYGIHACRRARPHRGVHRCPHMEWVGARYTQRLIDRETGAYPRAGARR